MINPIPEKTYDTAEKRWAGIGPYYAMFPAAFADKVLQKYTTEGDVVLDPFAGRGTTVYSAACMGRIGIGVEINPVGWVYAKAKLLPANQSDVENRLTRIATNIPKYSKPANELPPFFKGCFSYEVRKFLLAARELLNWRHCAADWTTMALILIYLHGKRDGSLSNQMRQAKSMSPPYALRWWKDHNLKPPEIDPNSFMLKRIKWRYAKGKPQRSGSQVYLGDCCLLLPRIGNMMDKKGLDSVQLLLTSPPYSGVTNYHYDQWLRLWLLGFLPEASYNRGQNKGRFNNADDYKKLLYLAFSKASKLLNHKAVVYVRTDSRKFTYQTTLQILKDVFPDKKILRTKQPFTRPTQTHLFGDRSYKPGEVDLVLEP